MPENAVNIDKAMIQEVVDKALAEVLKEQERMDSDEILNPNSNSVEDTIDKKEDTAPPSVTDVLKKDSIDTKDKDKKEDTSNSTEIIDIDEKVNEKVKEELDKNKKFSFLGIDITVNNKDGKYEVTLKTDDNEKVSMLDDASLPQILGLVEEFFDELVLKDDDTSDKKDEDKKENKDDDKNDDKELDKEDNDNKDDDEKDEDEDDYVDEFMSLESGNFSLVSSIQDLRKKYINRIEEVFNHGLEAKELALDLIKDKLLASNVKELIDKSNKKDTLIASKRQAITDASKKYIEASKFAKEFNNAAIVISSKLNNIKTDLEKNSLDTNLAKDLVKLYKSLISKLIMCNKSETIVANMQKLNDIKKAIISSYVDKSKQKTIVAGKIENNNNKNKINTIETPAKNVMNGNSMIRQKTVLANKRYDGIDEMSAEIMRIAGL